MKTTSEIIRADNGSDFYEATTVEMHGRTFSAGGACCVGDRLVGYLSPRHEEDGEAVGVPVILKTWDGAEMGRGLIISKWKLPLSAWHSTHMVQAWIRIGSEVFSGRGCGFGMIWKGKKVQE